MVATTLDELEREIKSQGRFEAIVFEMTHRGYPELGSCYAKELSDRDLKNAFIVAQTSTRILGSEIEKRGMDIPFC